MTSVKLRGNFNLFDVKSKAMGKVVLIFIIQLGFTYSKQNFATETDTSTTNSSHERKLDSMTVKPQHGNKKYP